MDTSIITGHGEQGMESLLPSLLSANLQYISTITTELLTTLSPQTYIGDAATALSSTPMVAAATPTYFTWNNFVAFMNAQGTWQWRLMSMTYFFFMFIYCILFAVSWNWAVATFNIGLKSDETKADESF